MKAAILHGPRDVRFGDLDAPRILQPTDAIIRLSATCICGSDLWPYRGVSETTQPTPMGHEYCGIVEEVGGDVTSLRPGQFVVGSFFASDNTCPHCRAGYQTSCMHRQPVAGAQAPLLRVPLADGTLVALLAVLASKHMGAQRIIVMSRHDSRQRLAREFGATDIVSERGAVGIGRIKQLTKGVGADSVLECVGTQESMQQAIGVARPGGYVSYVGVPHGVQLDGQKLFFTHVRLHGGPAPVRRYLPRFIEMIAKREIDPGKVFDLTLPLEQVAEGYRAMDERRAIKTLLTVERT
jgi:threonine dehydrogenase-like Zn-dependent dehydrogenase